VNLQFVSTVCDIRFSLQRNVFPMRENIFSSADLWNHQFHVHVPAFFAINSYTVETCLYHVISIVKEHSIKSSTMYRLFNTDRRYADRPCYIQSPLESYSRKRRFHLPLSSTPETIRRSIKEGKIEGTSIFKIVRRSTLIPYDHPLYRVYQFITTTSTRESGFVGQK